MGGRVRTDEPIFSKEGLRIIVTINYHTNTIVETIPLNDRLANADDVCCRYPRPRAK